MIWKKNKSMSTKKEFRTHSLPKSSLKANPKILNTLLADLVLWFVILWRQFVYRSLLAGRFRLEGVGISLQKELKYTIVNHSLLKFKTTILWNFDFLRKNYGIIEKSMVFWKKAMIPYRKLWNFDLRSKNKTMVDYR